MLNRSHLPVSIGAFVLGGAFALVVSGALRGPRSVDAPRPAPVPSTVALATLALAPSTPTSRSLPAAPSSVSVVPVDKATVAFPPAAPTPSTSAAMTTADWHKDADSRLAFFATLEGLYRDGISTEVANLIAGMNTDLDSKVKRNFVFQCKLCHAVYEAFVLYSRRQQFLGSKANTFNDGKIVDAKLLESLRSEDPYIRVNAMGKLVQPWMKRKLLSLNMEKKEKLALMNRLMKLVKEGSRKFSKIRSDPIYAGWSGYWSCQACNAVKTVAGSIR
jgi:hypothetical protein